MPYILLALGTLIGLYALYRFLMKANVQQIKALFLTIVIVVLALALFYLAVTGRLGAALGLLAALVPFIAGYIRNRTKKGKETPGGASSSDKPMNRKEALNILGLGENADEAQIREAYKKLMKKIHPDQEGSAWMAQKLNEAKDTLLKNK